jgi:group I intron endonuclease
MIGLYSIKHKGSGKQYIGSSVDIKGRITTHLKMLRRNEHHCDHLQRAWNLYGESEFILAPIMQAGTIEFIREIEQRYLDNFFGETLYNTNNKAIGAAYGDASAAKRPDWHMKSVRERFTKEELLEIYGKGRGHKRTEESKKLISIALLSQWQDVKLRDKRKISMRGKRAIVECPHCKLQGGGGNMKRYHFNKCKYANK